MKSPETKFELKPTYEKITYQAIETRGYLFAICIYMESHNPIFRKDCEYFHINGTITKDYLIKLTNLKNITSNETEYNF